VAARRDGQTLVHGDISASNLLITDAREVFLIDWAPAGRSPGFRAMWNVKMHAKPICAARKVRQPDVPGVYLR
jgi:hypothetical protein